MKKEAILHIPMSEYAHAVNEKQMLFRLRAAKSDLMSCILYIGDRACRQNPIIFTPVEMAVAYSDLLFDWWEIELDAPFRRMCYYFTLNDGSESSLYYADLFTNEISPERSEFYQFPFIHRADIAKAPDWANDAVIYNIFPDSFATSKRYIKKEPYQTEWNGITVNGKHGGTIRGITENVDYLLELGINCIYINPLFVAGEYHKYDLLDYYNVDPCFGTNADFADMVEVLHKNKIRIIIDGVFNHCGWYFFAFDDVVKNGKESRYAEWFYRLDFPVTRPESGDDLPGYECFAYERLMPKLDTTNPEVIEYFCNVCRHWLREYKIDGWRLDVADETNNAFWRAFQCAALEVNPDAFLIGEIWVNANYWLDGSIFHSSMNYDFRKHCRDFFATSRINAEEFNTRITNMLTRYRKNLTYTQLNILDSHDVSRFLSLCSGDKRRLKLALLFQMCFVGIPSIFYGDEQGLYGVLEEEYRRPMEWAAEEKELFEFYKWAVDLRKSNRAFSRGRFKTICFSESLLVFQRSYKDSVVTIAINAGDCTTYYLEHEISPYGFRIWDE